MKTEVMSKAEIIRRRLEGFEMWYRDPHNFRRVAFALLMESLA